LDRNGPVSLTSEQKNETRDKTQNINKNNEKKSSTVVLFHEERVHLLLPTTCLTLSNNK